MLLIPCRRKNRSLERSSKKQRPDKNSQNRPKRTEKQPHKKSEKHPKNPAKRGEKQQAKTRPKTKLENLCLACKVSAIVINHPGHRAMSSSDKTDPNVSRIPKKQGPKNRRNRKTENHQKRPHKTGKTGNKPRQTKTKQKQTRRRHEAGSPLFKIAEKIRPASSHSDHKLKN